MFIFTFRLFLRFFEIQHTNGLVWKLIFRISKVGIPLREKSLTNREKFLKKQNPNFLTSLLGFGEKKLNIC